jgi:hypothetical protein
MTIERSATGGGNRWADGAAASAKLAHCNASIPPTIFPTDIGDDREVATALMRCDVVGAGEGTAVKSGMTNLLASCLFRPADDMRHHRSSFACILWNIEART